MTDQQWHLPSPPLRASVVATDVTVFVAAMALVLLARAALPIGAAYAAKAAVLLAAGLLLPLGHIDGYHPYPRFGAANQVTTVRLALVMLLAGLVGEPGVPAIATAGVVVSIVVTILDGADGWLSRRTQQASAFGARLDMETDALLIQVLSILAWRYGKAGAWVLASGLMRYAFVMAGWLWSWMTRPLFPSLRRKTVCVVQVVGLIAAIAPIVPPAVSAPIAAVSLAALGYSFFVDTRWLWQHAS